MLIPPILAFLAVVATALPTMGLARRLGWVATPRDDRWHDRPTLLCGGPVLLAGLSSGALLLASWPEGSAAGWSIVPAMFLLGLADDLFGLSPVVKLALQSAIALAVLAAVPQLVPEGSPWVGVPLGALWLIGITNAFNLVDNMDGLAAGLATVAGLTLAGCGMVAGQSGVAGGGLVVAAAAAAFLLFNVRPARVFMGDSGSLMMGAALAVLGLQVEASGALATGWPLVPAAALAVPILDTAAVTLTRAVSGRSPFRGGCDHLSHRIVRLGLSEGEAVLTLCSLGAAWGVLAIGWLRQPSPGLAATAAVAALATVGLAAWLCRRAPGEASRGTRPAPERPGPSPLVDLRLSGGRRRAE